MTTDLKPRIRGLFNICVTPFDARNRLDTDALTDNIERVIECGYDGLLIGGTYGEFATLSTDERAELFRAATTAASGRVPVLLCAAAADVDTASRLTELAAELGGLPMLTPPYVSEITDAQTIRYFRDMAARSATGVMIYNAPGVAARTLTPDAIAALADIEGVIALKQGDLAPNTVDRLVGEVADRLQIIAASDLVMPAPLAAGVHGLSSTNSCAVPELIKAIHDALADNRLDRAGALHRAWYPLRRLCRAFGQPQTTKALMRLRGWRCGDVRAPLIGLDDDQTAALTRVWSALEKDERLAGIF